MENAIYLTSKINIQIRVQTKIQKESKNFEAGTFGYDSDSSNPFIWCLASMNLIHASFVTAFVIL